MSSTISPRKDVSVAEQLNEEDEQETVDEMVVEAVAAAFGRLFGTVRGSETDEAVEADKAVEADDPPGYTYRQRAGQTGGVRNVEYQEGVTSAGDIYEAAFDRLSDASTRSETGIARGVEYDLSIDGCAGRRIGQRRAEQGRLNRGSDVHRSDIPWRNEDDTLDEAVLQRYTLYTQERIEAELDELELINKQSAGDFKQDGRSERATTEVIAKPRQVVVTVIDGPDKSVDRDELLVNPAPEAAPDPRARLGKVSPDALGTVNKQASTLAEEYELSRAALSRWIAERITSQTPDVGDIIRAVSTVRERLDASPAVVSPIDTILSDADRVSVAGTVTQLFYPNDESQVQVGYIDDGTGSAKFTVWKKSDPNTLLHEGDEVAIKAATPGLYKGQPTLSIRHDSLMIVRETRNGPAKASRAPGDRSDPSPQRRDRAPSSLSPSIITSDAVPRPEHDRHDHIEETVFYPAQTPEWFPHRPDVRSLETTAVSKPTANGRRAYGITTRRRYEQGGVSWTDKKRREAKKNGRKRRLMEKKYGQKWYDQGTQRANDERYRSKMTQLFGAAAETVSLVLPWPGHEASSIPTLDDDQVHSL